jgi:hypothetical protein
MDEDRFMAEIEGARYHRACEIVAWARAKGMPDDMLRDLIAELGLSLGDFRDQL